MKREEAVGGEVCEEGGGSGVGGGSGEGEVCEEGGGSGEGEV